MDIREVDIEPQLEAGRVLIPRISEYAGVMLIQALRGVRAKIYFQPSDIEADAFSEASAPNDFNKSFNNAEAPPRPPRRFPSLKATIFHNWGVFQVIDTLIVSGMLSTRSLEALNSNEFTLTLTEALMRELKFKAVQTGRSRHHPHISPFNSLL